MLLRFCFRQTRTSLPARMFAAAAAVTFAAAAPALSAPEGPFSALFGNWSGNGLIKKANGSSERIRCRAGYTPAGANGLQLRLRCASDSYNFDLGANVTYNGGAFSGTWSETQRGVMGNIEGQASNNGRQVTATAGAAAFSANLTVTTQNNRQTVVILSPGAEVPEVDVSLDKGR